jgi:4-hydroxy-tetrahydrodipicolinate synthase
MNYFLKGTGVALVTPFNGSGSIDYESLTTLLEHVIAGGVEYLVAMGTTGESVALSKQEKKAVLNHIIEVNAGRLPLVVGIGGNNTASIIEDIRATNFENISAILSVSPYYNKPSQEGIFQHYKVIAEESPVPVILYNVPGRTGSNILPETTLRLAKECNNIVAIKEASGSIEQVMKILNQKEDEFIVISGDDALTLPMIACGAVGVISVVGNAYPKYFSDMVRLALNDDYSSARAIHYKLLKLIDCLFTEGNPCGIKAALNILGVCNEDVRLPLVKISSSLKSKIINCNNQIEEYSYARF